MLQHVWSLWLRSTTVVCRGWWMMTCTGWLFLRGCSTSSPWWSIVVFSTGLQDISPTTVCLCPLPVASIYDLSDVVSKFICSICSLQHVWEPWLFFSRQTTTVWNSLRDDLWHPAADCEYFLASIENTSIRQTSRSVSAMCFTLSPFTNRHLLTYLLTNVDSIAVCHNIMLTSRTNTVKQW